MTIEGRFYVRGGTSLHSYDRRVPITDGTGRVFCQTCLCAHKCPIGMDWHIERGPDEPDGVDRAACGVIVPVDDTASDVRSTRPKNVCIYCIAIKGDENEE